MARRSTYGPKALAVVWARYTPAPVYANGPDGVPVEQPPGVSVDILGAQVEAGEIGLFAAPALSSLEQVKGPDISGLVIRRGRYRLDVIDGGDMAIAEDVCDRTREVIESELARQEHPVPWSWPARKASTRKRK